MDDFRYKWLNAYYANLLKMTKEELIEFIMDNQYGEGWRGVIE